MKKEERRKPSGSLVDNDDFLRTLLRMPRKILENHEVDGLAQMVLHELGQKENLDLKRAFFLVSSPDFNYLKGVAGFCGNESSHCCKGMWEDTQMFYGHVQNTAFYADMKKLLQQERYHQDGALQKEEYLEDVGSILGMKSPQIHSWNLRNGNKGIFIFEEGSKKMCSTDKDILDHITALLGLCPL
ncbi:MAG: hypothetical protein V1855_04275 [bacterium]